MNNRVREVFGGPAIARSFSIPQDMSEAVTRRAIREERPASWIVQRALLIYLEGDRPAADDQCGEVEAGGRG